MLAKKVLMDDRKFICPNKDFNLIIYLFMLSINDKIIKDKLKISMVESAR